MLQAELAGATKEEKGGPVVGFGVGAVGAEEFEFGLAEGSFRLFATGDTAVEGAHEGGGAAVVDVPETGDDVLGAGFEEGPGEADETFAAVVAGAGAAAGGEGDEFGAPGQAADLGGGEGGAVVVAVEQEGGVKGIEGIGHGVDGEVDVAVAVNGFGKETGSAALVAVEAAGGGGREGGGDGGEFGAGVGEGLVGFGHEGGVAGQERPGGGGRAGGLQEEAREGATVRVTSSIQ